MSGIGFEAGSIYDLSIRCISSLLLFILMAITHKIDDAALVRPPPAGYLLAHSIDYFRSPLGTGFASDHYIFGKIAATHALSGVIILVVMNEI